VADELNNQTSRLELISFSLSNVNDPTTVGVFLFIC
jgi:hypothetical protein